MYENITGIQFKGAAFLKQTNMPFFSSKWREEEQNLCYLWQKWIWKKYNCQSNAKT